MLVLDSVAKVNDMESDDNHDLALKCTSEGWYW